jgi:hypothetical protein
MDEYRQHLENCLHLEKSKDKQDAEVIGEMLNEFAGDMQEVVEASGKLKIGFVREAHRIFTEARSQVVKNRVRMNEELQRSVIRITGAVFILFLVWSGITAIKSTVDNQFCEFYNVEGRTERYETQKPCER